jgi:NAD(P)H-hydrate repair Nnr-like enzyme with NAD(P)H-hydrate dehydratase domain
MIVLIGTVPYETGVYIGPARIDNDYLNIENVRFPIERGTAAMAAACAQVCRFYGLPLPLCVFGGDTSDGKGTDLMFREVNVSIEKYSPDIITLHYLFPKIAYGEPFISRVNSLPKRPQLIADAGGMYLMKTIKKSHLFDVFTPDEGELLFLADEFAAHPLYVRSELLKKVTDTSSLVESAYRHKNAARTLVVKGVVDRIYRDGVRIKECRGPNIPAMEAIGGTGDTITGMLSGLRYRKDEDADYKALVVNRLIGQRINCTPATQISEFIRAIPAVLEDYEKNPG